MAACLGLLAVVYALVAGLKTVVDFDLGWQMASGSYVLTHHAIARSEIFSYTVPGREWIYPVLPGVVFTLLYRLGGYAAISWWVALACAATAAVLVYRRGAGAAVLCVLAVPVLASETMPRASLFTLFFFACYARILIDHFSKGDSAGFGSSAAGAPVRLWLLPVIMVLWANLHMGFVAGCALAGAYAGAEALELPFAGRRSAALQRCRQAMPWLLASVLVTVANPWGVRVFTAIARQQAVVAQQSASLAEWQPVRAAQVLTQLGWHSPDSARWWMLGIGVVLAFLCLWRRRVGPAMILVAAIAASLKHQRMEGPCVVLICLIGGSMLRQVEWQRVSRIAVASVCLATTSLAAVRCFDLVTDRTYLSSGAVTLFGAGPSWWMPGRAVDFVAARHVPANLFSEFNLSSYLVWRLGPAYPDFADGRYVPFGPGLFQEQQRLTSLPLDAPEWTRAAAKYQIRSVIFPLARIDAPAVPLLADCASAGWKPVYLDATAVIFVRKDAGAADLPALDCQTHELLPAMPPANNSYRERAEQYERLTNASAVLAQLGRLREARLAADRAEVAAADLQVQDVTLHFVRAQIAIGEQQPIEAEQELRKALAIQETGAGWYNLGLLYRSQGRSAEAATAIKQARRF